MTLKQVLQLFSYVLIIFFLYIGGTKLFQSNIWYLMPMYILLTICIIYRIFKNIRQMKIFSFVFFALFLTTACNRPEPNFEGVLMTNYGKNGLSDFNTVAGAQGPLGPGSELYQIPMFEQKADAPDLGVTTKDGGYYKVDPQYSYEAIRGKGPEICFNYKHIGPSDANGFMDNIEVNILNPLVLNAYREEARNYGTDSLLKNTARYELAVENRLKTEFNNKFFNLLTLSSGLRPPESMIKAIEDRNNTIQKTEQARNELEIARIELEKAKIEREKDLVKSQGLTKEILTDKWIQAIQNTNNKVIVTDGKTPVIIQQ